jgi:hypothetical protein
VTATPRLVTVFNSRNFYVTGTHLLKEIRDFIINLHDQKVEDEVKISSRKM